MRRVLVITEHVTHIEVYAQPVGVEAVNEIEPFQRRIEQPIPYIFQAEVDALAAKLAAKAPFATKITKQALREQPTMGLEAALDFDAYVQALCMTTDDHREGYDAFREKRDPRFNPI